MCLYPELSEQLSTVQALYTPHVLSDIEENFHTSNIEGAKIETIHETLQILKSNKIVDKKSSMVIGYSDALKYLKSTQNIDLLKLNSLLVHNDRGYRDNSVYVGTMFDVIFKPIDCKYVPGLLLQLKDGFDTGNVILESILLHYFFVWLHPFYDGNGRTTRLLMKEYLYRNGYAINISKCIDNHLSRYYRSLQNSDEEKDVTYFIAYMLDIIEEELSYS